MAHGKAWWTPSRLRMYRRTNMNVTLDLRYGPNKDKVVTREELQRTIDAIHRASATANAHDGTLLCDAAGIFIAIARQLPTERRPRATINLPRSAIPNFTRAGNAICEKCGLHTRDHQLYRYTDDPENDTGLLLFRLCDGREVKL
jgi:hypothetical protein